MSFTQIILEKKPPVAKITLNRPEALNALSPTLVNELRQALKDIEQDPQIRVLVLTGSGRAFCAGADLKFMAQASQKDLYDYIQSLDEFLFRLECCDKPVIAAVNGYALAGGLELTLCCDLVVASEQAIFGDEHINRGLMPGGGSTMRLPRVIGLRRAKELLYTGDRWDAKRALEAGLVNTVVPPEKLEEAAMGLAQKIATKSGFALRLIKQVVNQSMDSDRETLQTLERAAFNLVVSSPEAQEGLRAFLSKKP
ncbi:MAG: enoyl-CoA hydratase/isomerase family protein [Nitrososphaerales archaeon]